MSLERALIGFAVLAGLIGVLVVLLWLDVVDRRRNGNGDA